MEKYCGLYLKDACFYVFPSSLVFGAWLAHKPYFKFLFDVGIEEIGRNIMKALEESKEKAEPPENPKQERLEFYKFLGTKNFKKFSLNTLFLTIIQRNDIIQVSPYKRDALNGGFLIMENRNKTCRNNPGEIGKLVLEQLKECK